MKELAKKIEKKYGVKFASIKKDVCTDDYIFLIDKKEFPTVMDMIEVIEGFIKLKQKKRLQKVVKANNFPQVINELAELVLRDPLNELEILEETDDYVVFINSCYIGSNL